MNLLQTIVGFFSGGAGAKIGDGVAIASVIAALGPGVLWLVGHRDDNAVSFTFGQLAIFAALLGFVALVLYFTRRGQ